MKASLIKVRRVSYACASPARRCLLPRATPVEARKSDKSYENAG